MRQLSNPTRPSSKSSAPKAGPPSNSHRRHPRRIRSFWFAYPRHPSTPKRSDIASTAEAYARSAFEVLGADGVTLNPYLGKDSIEPFIKNREKVYSCCARPPIPVVEDLQEFEYPWQRAKRLHVHVAGLAQTWNTRNILAWWSVQPTPNPGTSPPCRTHLWFLVPGIGTSGRRPAICIESGPAPGWQRILINVSRTIARADDPRLGRGRVARRPGPRN